MAQRNSINDDLRPFPDPRDLQPLEPQPRTYADVVRTPPTSSRSSTTDRTPHQHSYAVGDFGDPQ